MNQLATIPPSPLDTIPRGGVTVAQAIAALLAAPNENTRRTYSRALASFAAFIGLDSGSEAAIKLLSLEHGSANLLVMQYRAWLVQRNDAAKTINLKLSALRAASKLARRLGAISWAIDVPSVDASDYRDTAGPPIGIVREMFQRAAHDPSGAVGIRNAAILALLFDLGLRRQSVVDLDLGDVDLPSRKLSVKLKGRHDHEAFTIPEPTAARLQAWIDARGGEAGALFTRLDHGGDGGRICGESIRRLVKRAGRRAGVETHPHALRHSAATAVATQTGSVFSVQAFLRHQSPSTAQFYVDNLADLGGDAAARVAAMR